MSIFALNKQKGRRTMTSTEEYLRRKRFLEAAKEVESYNSEQALQALKEIGILDNKGELAAEYR